MDSIGHGLSAAEGCSPGNASAGPAGRRDHAQTNPASVPGGVRSAEIVRRSGGLRSRYIRAYVAVTSASAMIATMARRTGSSAPPRPLSVESVARSTGFGSESGTATDEADGAGAVRRDRDRGDRTEVGCRRRCPGRPRRHHRRRSHRRPGAGRRVREWSSAGRTWCRRRCSWSASGCGCPPPAVAGVRGGRAAATAGRQVGQAQPWPGWDGRFVIGGTDSVIGPTLTSPPGTWRDAALGVLAGDDLADPGELAAGGQADGMAVERDL